MSKWRKGQEVYETLVSNIGQYISEQTLEGYIDTHQVLALAKSHIPDFISNLRVSDLVLIHEYLMYVTEMRPDVRVPAYTYSGGDRVISVTRYLLKNIDHELAKQYV